MINTLEYALLDANGTVEAVIVADSAFIESHPQKDRFQRTHNKVGIGHELGDKNYPELRHVAAVFKKPGEGDAVASPKVKP